MFRVWTVHSSAIVHRFCRRFSTRNLVRHQQKCDRVGHKKNKKTRRQKKKKKKKKVERNVNFHCTLFPSPSLWTHFPNALFRCTFRMYFLDPVDRFLMHFFVWFADRFLMQYAARFTMQFPNRKTTYFTTVDYVCVCSSLFFRTFSPSHFFFSAFFRHSTHIQHYSTLNVKCPFISPHHTNVYYISDRRWILWQTTNSILFFVRAASICMPI